MKSTKPNIARTIEPIRCNRKIDLAEAIELRAKGLTYQQIADHYDCSISSVHERLHKYFPETSDFNGFKKHRADIFAALQDRLVSSITEEDIKKTPAAQRVIMTGVLYDKERIERGQATQIIDYHGTSQKTRELEEEIAALEAEFEEVKEDDSTVRKVSAGENIVNKNE